MHESLNLALLKPLVHDDQSSIVDGTPFVISDQGRVRSAIVVGESFCQFYVYVFLGTGILWQEGLLLSL